MNRSPPKTSLIVNAGTSRAFAIVGVGASAGGLDAFRELLAHLPPEPGMALVLVQHLEATRASLLGAALARATKMHVAEARDGVQVEPNRVYVIPPGAQLTIEQGVLRVSPLGKEELRPHLPIDFFLRSLAADRGRQAIGVILSGTASDGTAGLAAIRSHGGITFVQDPRSARFGQMPQSAIDAGVVDFCLPLPALGAELARMARHPYVARGDRVPPTAAGAESLARILALVRAATGVDFAEHRPTTFRRRLARRLVVRQARDLDAYVEILRHDPGEVHALHDDLLIKVTSFFREERSFDELKRVAYPEILKGKPPGAPVRVWVVGCASGEEVYSLAISLVEHLGETVHDHPVLLFGSDLDGKAVERARAGLYSDAAVQGLGEERLRRFFVRTEGGWRVAQAIRDLCIFVHHDVGRDPPFSRLDLLSCRNVLIYFGQALQRRVLAAAHYALDVPGFLLLGTTESTVGLPRWFVPVSKGSGLFRRRPGASKFRFAPRGSALARGMSTPPADSVSPRVDVSLARLADEAVLARYGPPGVVLNERLEVVQFRGRTGPFLEAPDGEPQSQVLKMARPGLAAVLRTALADARRTSAPVCKAQIPVDRSRDGQACDLVVLPMKGSAEGERAFVVLFEECPPAARARRNGQSTMRSGPRGTRGLEEELSATKEYVAVLLEEQGRAADALASANDGLVSGNEELQSLNEELETAKEELQATNEELNTVNDELNGRNQDLQVVNTDLVNLLDAVEVPIVILDGNRRIRRYTARAATSLGLLPAHMGRRIGEIDLPIRAPDLERWIARSTKEGILVEAEVQDRADRWHRLRIRSHRASEGTTDGTILSLVDIDDLHHQVISALWARDYATNIVEGVQVPIVVLDAGLCVLSANAAYYRVFAERPERTEGQGFFGLAAGEWDVPELRQAVVGTLGEKGRFQGLAVERRILGDGHRTASVSGCSLPSPDGTKLVLLSIEEASP